MVYLYNMHYKCTLYLPMWIYGMMQTRRPDNQAWRPPNPGGLLHSDKLAIFTGRRPRVLIFYHGSRISVLTPPSCSQWKLIMQASTPGEEVGQDIRKYLRRKYGWISLRSLISTAYPIVNTLYISNSIHQCVRIAICRPLPPNEQG